MPNMAPRGGGPHIKQPALQGDVGLKAVDLRSGQPSAHFAGGTIFSKSNLAG